MALEEHDIQVLGVQPEDDEAKKTALNPFTPAERRALRVLTRFNSTAEMAEHLGISAHTVEKHIENMERKLKVHSRARLVYRAMVLGYLR